MLTTFEGALPLTIEDLNSSILADGTPGQTLDNIVLLVANRFETDVCSVYLLEADRAGLVLAATVGLRQDCVGKLRMSLREGLAGLVAEHMWPVAVEDAAQHPRFKYFAEAEEDAYQSFLGVPLVDRGVLQGVLVVQTVEPRRFSPEEIQRLQDAARILGPIVSDAR